MGWSCRKEASEVIQKWTDFCYNKFGSQNVFVVKNVKYFWEVSRKEHNDGAITGSIFKFTSETHCKRSGSFRVEGNGDVALAPRLLKDIANGVGSLSNWG